MGKIEQVDDHLLFRGGKYQSEDGTSANLVGMFISNKAFSGGTASVKVKFSSVGGNAAAELILFYDPQTKISLHAGITSQNLFSIRQFQNQWTLLEGAGAQDAIEVNREYLIEASVTGSVITLKIDDVLAIKTNLPFVPARTQAGLFAKRLPIINSVNFQQKFILYRLPNPSTISSTSASMVRVLRALKAIHSYFILCHNFSMRFSSGL